MYKNVMSEANIASGFKKTKNRIEMWEVSGQLSEIFSKTDDKTDEADEKADEEAQDRTDDEQPDTTDMPNLESEESTEQRNQKGQGL